MWGVFVTILVAPHRIVITYIWEKNMIVLYIFTENGNVFRQVQ